MASPTTAKPSMSSLTALVKRRDADLALMPPPPPTKRIKRPATVLDEDDYTDALSDIIARDYFPGLAEVKAQEEYINALDSNNTSWIREAGQNLLHASTPLPNHQRRTTRDTRFDTNRSWNTATPVPDTPRGNTGSETPMSIAGSASTEQTDVKPIVDTTKLSLSEFQSKYTSEDNESFYTVLDKQNDARRKKYAYLWTEDQRIPTSRQIAHREQETRLIEQKKEATAANSGRELIPITTGATEFRPAKPDSWRQKQPANTFMFSPTSVDEHGLQTVMEVKEKNSKAGPKEVVHANTRFPPSNQFDSADYRSIPPSPSLNTAIIARRDAAGAERGSISSATDFPAGSETPRVNGYSFVDEDEPENIPDTTELPSYRDLLAGQTGDSTPNPFKIHDIRKREDLHRRLVEKDNSRKREKDRMVERSGGGGGGGTAAGGNMTPAARMLMAQLGKTPVRDGLVSKAKEERMSSKEMWTPVATPRRKRKEVV